MKRSWLVLGQVNKVDGRTPHHNSTWSNSLSGQHQLVSNTAKPASHIWGLTINNVILITSLKTCYQEHIIYIRTNNPQSAYAQHTLHNQHEYGTMHKLMTLLKPLKNANAPIPYEQLYIQSLHQGGNLISEQCPGEPNPLFQLASHPP
jgi:hypothetical protein